MLRWVFRLVRTPAAGYFVGLIFAYFSFVIPTRRLRETKTLIAFHHPQPSYPTHILIVPKKQLQDMTSLDATDSEFMQDLFAVTA